VDNDKGLCRRPLRRVLEKRIKNTL